MPTLRDASGPIAEAWLRLDPGAEFPDGARVILTWRAGLVLPPLPAHMLGLHIANDADPAALAPLLRRVALVSVAFPSFSDGRGFSLARRLRALGFRGRLRAAGPVIADQFEYLLACGFDEVESPEKLDARQPQSQWAAALGQVSMAYQPGYGGRAGIWAARRSGQVPS